MVGLWQPHTATYDIQRFGTILRYSDIVVHSGTAWIIEAPSSADCSIEAQPGWRVEIALMAATAD